ncbi:MAG: hypothetical protein SGPRY_000791 [Prymnesium sp.]
MSGSRRASVEGLTERVLQSSPVLEAFGNAQTVRNDNSSRFGKFLRILYDVSAQQMGAHIDTYLLERSRIVRPPEREANYHVLYAIVDGMSLGSMSDYSSLPMGTRRQDPGAWEKVKAALSTIGFSDLEISYLTESLSAGKRASSWLGFEGRDADSGEREAVVCDADGTVIASASRFLSVKPELLADSLICRRTYLATGDSYVKALDEFQAADAADALGKALYGRNFDWLVSRTGLYSLPNAQFTYAMGGCIGILDIFGFESFQTNSFEQICINYANEDNAPTLEMLGARRIGLFAILDEECRLQAGRIRIRFAHPWQTGTAKSFVDKIASAYPKSELKRDAAPSFTITHYAGKVTYETELFLVKNTDPLHPELLELMQTSSAPKSFDDLLVTDQLRCAGMIEAVRISRAAYPNRLRHEYFMQRFCMLAPDESDVPSLLAKLLPEGGYCIGKTKIFFKPRIMPMLESKRTALCSMLATRLQRVSRGRKARLFFLASRRAVLKIQSAARLMSAHRVAAKRRKSASNIGRISRGHVARCTKMCVRMC